MLERFLCFVGLHRWFYLNKKEDCRICGRANCHASQVKEQAFCACPACDGYRFIWKNANE